MERHWKNFTILASCVLCSFVALLSSLHFLFQKPLLSKIAFQNVELSVEIARTPEELELGLGNRDSLCPKCGMLFVFDDDNRRAFWMKGMKFPIDIIWMRAGEVVFVEQNVDFSDQNKIYYPTEKADSVLEVNAGTCETYDIRKGNEGRVSL